MRRRMMMERGSGGGSTLWTPAALSPSFWYDASDADYFASDANGIVTWNDRSGNGWHLTRVSDSLVPTLSNTGPGGRQVLNSKTMRNSGFSGFNGLTAVSQVAVFRTASTANQVLLNHEAASSFLQQFSGRVYSYVAAGTFGSVLNSGSEGPLILGNYHIAAGTIDYAAASLSVALKLYANGSANTILTSFTGTKPNQSATSNGLWVGTVSAPGADWEGEIGELLGFASLLSTSNRNKLEGYLAHKWGLTGNLPADHPYKLNPPES